MAAKHTTSRSMKSISGISVLAVGLFLLFANLDSVATQFNHAAGARAEVLGFLPALVLAGLHGIQAYLSDDSGLFLSSLLQMLVSFWPLLLIATGTLLLRPLILGETALQGSRAGSPAMQVRGDR
jgi:hypothetical protein